MLSLRFHKTCVEFDPRMMLFWTAMCRSDMCVYALEPARLQL